MLLQRAGTGTIPPSGFIRPNWDVLVKSWDAAPEPESPTVQLGPTTVTLGHDDDEADDHLLYTPDHAFGWDNEHPQRQVNVGKFRIDWRPVTNGEFYLFYLAEGKGLVQRPESWVEVAGELQVCQHSLTKYIPVLINGWIGSYAVRSSPYASRVELACHHVR